MFFIFLYSHQDYIYFIKNTEQCEKYICKITEKSTNSLLSGHYPLIL